MAFNPPNMRQLELQNENMFTAKQHLAMQNFQNQMMNRQSPPSYDDSVNTNGGTNPFNNIFSGLMSGLGPVGGLVNGAMQGISSLINSNSQRDINKANLAAQAKQFDAMLAQGMNPYTGRGMTQPIRGLGFSAPNGATGMENPFR